MGTIVTQAQVIPRSTAEAACRSLDEEVDRLRAQGKLENNKLSSLRLEWTPETKEIMNAFAKAAPDLAQIKNIGGNPNGNLGWGCPIIYTDIPDVPLQYPSSILGRGIVGIVALGTLVLPEFGNSGPTTIESGSVVYFRGSAPVHFKECKGRGIMFNIQ